MRLDLVTLFLLAFLAAASRADGLRQHLAALSAPSAEARAAAERWLGGHLTAADYDELSRAAREGDAEVRMRLARVLGGDERHLQLALRFLAEPRADLAAIGREAVHASIVAFDPHLGEPAVRGRALEERLGKLADGGIPRLFRLDPSEPLERSLRALATLADLPVGLVVDEGIAERAVRRRGEPLVGSWNELLLRLADLQGVALEAHGGGDEPDDPPLFLRFSAQSAEAGTRGAELVQDWLEAVVQHGDSGQRRWAARNLVAAGFLPVIGWLDARLRDAADDAALEGLLVGAAIGHVSPALREPETLRALIGGLPSASPDRWIDLLRGLSRVGCRASDGTSIPGILLEGFTSADVRGRWARLFLCGELGCADDLVEQTARRALLEEGATPGLRRRALSVLSALGSPAPEMSEPVRRDLFRHVRDDGDAERLALQLVAAEVELPVMDEALLAELRPAGRLSLLLARLYRGEVDPAADLLGVIAADAPAETIDDVASALERIARDGERRLVLATVARARRSSADLGLERIAILLGALTESDLAALAARGSGWLEEADSALLGGLAGTLPEPSGLGTAARGQLLTRASDVAGAGGQVDRRLLEGLGRAVSGLFERREDDQARSFARAAQAALLSETRSEMGRAFAARLRQVPGVMVVDVTGEGKDRLLPPTN